MNKTYESQNVVLRKDKWVRSETFVAQNVKTIIKPKFCIEQWNENRKKYKVLAHLDKTYSRVPREIF